MLSKFALITLAVLGNALLWLSFLWSIFCLVVIAGNGFVFDCNLASAAFMGILMAIPTTLGFVIAVCERMVSYRPKKLLVIIFLMAISVQGAIGLSAHYFETEDSCVSQSPEGLEAGTFDSLKKIFPVTQTHLRGNAVKSKDGKTYLLLDDDGGGKCFLDGKPWTAKPYKPAQVAPGAHQIKCVFGDIGFEIPEGTVFHFNYWGP